jgi:hypothetical protein
VSSIGRPSVQILIIWETEKDLQVLQECHERGWLYSRSEPMRSIYYFATPLHRWFVSFNLLGMEPTEPLETQIVDFVLRVLRGFSRSRLTASQSKMRDYERVAENRYQTEFYRSCGTSTAHIFPEFTSSTGRVAFYVPSEKWAIELSHNGDNIQGHCKRFSGLSGNRFVPVAEYIILDCRETSPTTVQSGM